MTRNENMEEVWKDIKGYEGLYQVSNLGRVRSLDREVKCRTSSSGVSKRKGYILKPGIASNGYLMVALYNNKVQKCRTMHSLIAEAFIPNPDMLPCVNHKNGNRTDNRLENLEWVTYSENNYHAVRKLGRTSPWKGKFGKDNPHSKPVIQLSKDGKIIAEYESAKDAARKLNTSQGRISDCCRGEKKYHLGYIWKYI